MVTNTNQKAAGILSNELNTGKLALKTKSTTNQYYTVIPYLGFPEASTNVSKVTSQIPLSAKYSNVEKSTRLVTKKKKSAERASPERRKATIMTSMVMTIVLLYL
jgi:hypothetical protein